MIVVLEGFVALTHLGASRERGRHAASQRKAAVVAEMKTNGTNWCAGKDWRRIDPEKIQPQITGATILANALTVPEIPLTRALTTSSHELLMIIVMETKPIPRAQILTHCETSAMNHIITSLDAKDAKGASRHTMAKRETPNLKAWTAPSVSHILLYSVS